MAVEARFDAMVGALQLFGKPGGRVVDVGCGDGALVERLRRAGFFASGIDPKAQGIEHCTDLALEVFHPAERFAMVTARVSLHHTKNIAQTMQHIRDLLVPGGVAVILEFAWEEMDLPTMRWAQEILQPHSYAELDERAALEHWFEQHGDLHSGASMLRCLSLLFRTQRYERLPYLAWMADRDDKVSNEIQHIEAGKIRPLGFLFVGRT